MDLLTQVLMSDSDTRQQVHQMCLELVLDALTKPKDEKSFKQFSLFARCLRYHHRQQLVYDTPSTPSIGLLDEMLLTTELLATANLESVTCVRKSLAPVDRVLFPNAQDSGNAIIGRLSLVCPTYAHRLPLVCASSAPRMRIVCPSYAHRMPLVRPSYAPRMRIVCPSYAHRMPHRLP